MIEEAKEAIVASSKSSSVYIGCDSQRYKKGKQFMATYALVIVLHKDSKHGGRIFSFIEDLPDYGKGTEGLRMRLMNEVGYLVRAASEIVDFIDERHLELHCDLNPDPMHKSNVVVKEAMGYVRGVFGFDPKIKPHSWAATHAGDHVVRH